MSVVTVQKTFGFIINPGADRSRARKRFAQLDAEVGVRWPGSKLYTTSNKQDIGEKARLAAEQFQNVVACGGDGTINQVFEALAGTSANIGIIPMGSGNDFVKTVGIPRNFDKALEVLDTCDAHPTDIIRYTVVCNEGKISGICANTMGIGFDGLVNFETSRLTWLRGPLMYAVAAFRSANRSVKSEVTLTVDGVPSREDLIMVCCANGQVEGGNFQVAPQAKIDDGVINLVTVPPVGVFTLLTRLPLFLVGQSHRTRIVQQRLARTLSADFSVPLPMHADGEQISRTVRSLSLEVDSAAVRVIRPDEL
jgi:diacylglycerol kinase (ATP)